MVVADAFAHAASNMPTYAMPKEAHAHKLCLIWKLQQHGSGIGLHARPGV